MYALELSNLSFSYNKKAQILDDVSLRLNGGDIFSLIGPNGTGKTTLMKLILNVIPTSESTIKINGILNSDERALMHVFFVPSEELLPTYLTGNEYLQYLMQMYNLSSNDDEQKILAKKMFLDGHMNDLIQNYSYGMKKKIQLIGAFLINPKLLILDETLNGLDIDAKRVTLDLIKEYTSKGGAVIFCTHSFELIDSLGGSIILLNNGVLQGPFSYDFVIKNYGTVENAFHSRYVGKKGDL